MSAARKYEDVIPSAPPGADIAAQRYHTAGISSDRKGGYRLNDIRLAAYDIRRRCASADDIFPLRGNTGKMGQCPE